MAMRENGFGQLTTIELDTEVAQYATANIEETGLSDWAHVIVGNSLDHRPEHEIQFVLLDSDIAIRHEEFRHFYDSPADGALLVFNDTGPQHGGLAERGPIFPDSLICQGLANSQCDRVPALAAPSQGRA
jgi:predicted O-methyltransferase YrrM